MSELSHLTKEKKLETLGPQSTVIEAAKKMSENRVGSLLIMEGEKIIGIFTERDLVNRVIAQGRDYNTTTLSEVMSTDITTIGKNASLTECYKIMNKKHCRHLPIVDENQKIIGVVSMRDLLDWRIRDMEFENRELMHYIMS